MKQDIKNYDFKEGLPIEFEMQDLHHLYEQHSDKITNPHRTGFYHIIWFQKGSSRHLVDFSPVDLAPNSFLFLNKEVVQAFDKKGDFEGKIILFTDSFFGRSDEDMKYLQGSILFNDLLSVSTIQLCERNHSFEHLFYLMQKESNQPARLYQPDILQNFLHSFLLMADRERRKQGFKEIKKGPDFDYFLLFKDLLETGFKENKQVNFYSSKLNITEKRLNQATTNIFGKTPKQLIDGRVMLEAKRLLAHTGDTIKEVGYKLGFEEPTNFIKYFKNHYNGTPVEFRESLLQ